MKSSFHIIALSLALLFVAEPVMAQMAASSTNYVLQSDSLNFAGILSTSTSYGIEDTLGEAAASQGDSLSYSSLLGYQFMQLDIVAPGSTPNLLATPISPNAIELTWDAAFDDYGVDRYYIYRDGVRITDVASFPRDYADQGLTQATQYQYNVSAVDAAGHEGPWSATSTASTPSIRRSTSSGAPSVNDLYVNDFQTTANDVNALITFSSSRIASADVYWGTDLNYRSGHLTDTAALPHFFLLAPLSPNTLYHLKVVLQDGRGKTTTTESTFRTLKVGISEAPANVTEFNASSTASTVELDWKLPLDLSVVGARIVRSEKGHPGSPTDGEVIFENKDASGIEHYTDASAKAGTTYYYALFTEDLAGNFSSGALAEATILKPGQTPPTPSLESLIHAGSVDVKIEKLAIKDFLFIQDGNSVKIDGDLVTVLGNKNITVVLKYYKVPPVLKTIAVTLVTRTPQPKHFTFILRANRDRTRYEATIGNLGQEKNYTLRIDILDFQSQGLKTIRGTLAVKAPVIVPVGFGEKVGKALGWSFLLALLLALLAAAAYYVKKRFFLGKPLPWALLKKP